MVKIVKLAGFVDKKSAKQKIASYNQLIISDL